MMRSPGAAGFDQLSAPVASSRLAGAVAASLAIGSISLCLIVTLTVLSIKISAAMPIPGYATMSSPATGAAPRAATARYGATWRAYQAHDHS